MTSRGMALVREHRAVDPSATALVLAAMREELAPLVAGLDGTRRVALEGPRRTWAAELAGRPLVVACSGIGALQATRGAEALLERFPAAVLVGVGVAGGLTAELEPGALVVASTVHGPGGSAVRADPAWTERALRVGGTLAGTFVTTERVLATAEDKARVRSTLGVSGPAVVDLESSAWAAAAARHGVPCVFARAVCDTAADDLPFDIEACRDATGEISRAKVARRLLWRPTAAPALWELRRRMNVCSMALARFVEDLLQ